MIIDKRIMKLKLTSGITFLKTFPIVRSIMLINMQVKDMLNVGKIIGIRTAATM